MEIREREVTQEILLDVADYLYEDEETGKACSQRGSRAGQQGSPLFNQNIQKMGILKTETTNFTLICSKAIRNFALHCPPPHRTKSIFTNFGPTLWTKLATALNVVRGFIGHRLIWNLPSWVRESWIHHSQYLTLSNHLGSLYC